MSNKTMAPIHDVDNNEGQPTHPADCLALGSGPSGGRNLCSTQAGIGAAVSIFSLKPLEELPHLHVRQSLEELPHLHVSQSKPDADEVVESPILDSAAEARRSTGNILSHAVVELNYKIKKSVTSKALT